MKLKFSIEYATQWGQSLHVLLSYHYQDGAVRNVNLPMQTQDGQWWMVESAVIDSRQHPVTAITYSYQVEDQEGTVLRREWALVPRTFFFDASKDFFFPDQWRDIPLCLHLYTNAYLTTRTSSTPLLREEQGRGHSPLTLAKNAEDVLPLVHRVPFFRKTLLFRVSAPQLEPGQSVALIGSHPALGCWNPTRYQPMDYIGQSEWELSVNADAMTLPLEYKFVVVDDQKHELLQWEDGDNRTTGDVPMDDGQVVVHYGQPLRLKERTWRLAGAVLPVFALRSDHSFGVGDFGDLRRIVDWAVETGMKVIQILPVNDTNVYHHLNACPYHIVSCFALNPLYIDLEQLPTLDDKKKMTVYRRQQHELNALSQCDYEAVERVKTDYVSDVFEESGRQVLQSDAFSSWFADNSAWLEPYARWKMESISTQLPSHPRGGAGVGHAMDAASGKGQDHFIDMVYFVQYNLHLQLKAAADYARAKGVFIKGDVPLGVCRHSAETALHPDFFWLDSQTGTTPDAQSPMGHNWEFPTYRWTDLAPAPADKAPQHQLSLMTWWQQRLKWMEQYFDAIRLDHVLAWFRTWEVPDHAVYALLGHFSPAFPLTPEEIEYSGLTFRRDLYTRPFINDRVLERLFGIHAQYVRERFLIKRSYGLYELKADYDTQRKVRDCFQGLTDENSLWICEGLMRLVSNVLFVEDPRQNGMYHPRINAWRDMAIEAIASAEEREAYMRLYNNFFYERHSFLWGANAMRRLSDMMAHTHLLVCAEDLGDLPDCVSPVLDALRMLTLEVQAQPKQQGYEFCHLEAYPYRSVCTFETHDMSPLRLWWEESPQRTQRYYATMLQKQGRAPEHLPAHLAEEIIARHLYSPSMLCILSIQDWLAMDVELRTKNVRQERINDPADPYNKWNYRMHLTIEQLLKASRFNGKLRTMVSRSKR